MSLDILSSALKAAQLAHEASTRWTKAPGELATLRQEIENFKMLAARIRWIISARDCPKDLRIDLDKTVNAAKADYNELIQFLNEHKHLTMWDRLFGVNTDDLSTWRIKLQSHCYTINIILAAYNVEQDIKKKAGERKAKERRAEEKKVKEREVKEREAKEKEANKKEANKKEAKGKKAKEIKAKKTNTKGANTKETNTKETNTKDTKTKDTKTKDTKTKDTKTKDTKAKDTKSKEKTKEKKAEDKATNIEG
jgi:hypothetical protein